MEKLTIDNVKKIEAAIHLIDKIVTLGNTTINKLPTEKHLIINFIAICYLERLVHNLDTLNILLQQYKTKPHVETVIGITIRANLLDFMTLSNLCTYLNDENNDKEIEILITDQFLNTLKYLKSIKGSVLLDQEEYKSILEKFWKNYSFIFKDDMVDYENPEDKLIRNEHKSPKDLFKRISNHPLTKKFSNVYDLYMYYSKYDHFGIMTYYMKKQGPNDDIERIIDGIKYIIQGIIICYPLIKSSTYDISGYFKQIKVLQEKFNTL